MHCATRSRKKGGGWVGGKALIPYSYRRTSTDEHIYNTTIIFPTVVELQTFLTSKIQTPLQWGHLALSLRCPN